MFNAKKVKHVLGKISSSIPSFLRSNVTKKEVDHTQEEMAQVVMQDKNVSEQAKERVRKALYEGKLHSETEEVNEEVTKKIDEYHAIQIAKAKEQGALPDPMEDPFYRKTLERSQRIAEGKEQPRKAPEVSREEAREAVAKMNFDRSGDPHKRKFY